MMSEVREGGLDRGLKRYYFILVCNQQEARNGPMVGSDKKNNI